MKSDRAVTYAWRGKENSARNFGDIVSEEGGGVSEDFDGVLFFPRSDHFITYFEIVIEISTEHDSRFSSPPPVCLRKTWPFSIAG